MIVLGIESTCDETGCAVVKDGFEVLSNIVASQIELHNEFGGVVPELACRRHVDAMLPVIEEALEVARCKLQDVDLIAVAYGPGLVGALLIGMQTAKSLSLAINKPFIGVNHVEAHLYAALMNASSPETLSVLFPSLGVILSGGHTTLLKMNAIGSYQLIGETIDDAIGESFDKVAKMLGLRYPGGPVIESLALQGDKNRFPFRGGRVKGHPKHFSFSGLKTNVLYTLKKLPHPLTHTDVCDLAASFQEAAMQDVVHKSILAAREAKCSTIILGGGVTQNQYLRKLFAEQAPDLRVIWPPLSLTLDNAAMIAGLGYHRYLLQGHGDSLDLEPQTRIEF